MYVIGLDIGTTCTKALLSDADGKILSVGSSGYPLLSDGSHIEQRAEDWIKASVAAVHEVIKDIAAEEVAGISLSTQGGSTVAIDKDGRFIGNAVTWMDTRAKEEAEEIERELGNEYIYHTTGWKINPALDASKLRCLKKEKKYAGARQWLTTLEVMNRFLTGRAVIDPTNAAMRQLYHVEQNRWDKKLMQAAGIEESELPEVLPTGVFLGTLQKEAADKLGLQEGVSVFNGAHDQYCASIGAGAVNVGDMLLSAGTTWVLMGIGDKPLFTESFIAPGKHPVEGLYGAIASLVCSGASLQWFKNEFIPEDFEELNKEAAQRREKAKELFFYPYLAGANYPIWNLNARGAFTGLALEHDRFDMARAIMEGVAFGVRKSIADFEANGYDIKQIIMMGGASKSPMWCQMIASVTGVPILKLDQSDVCAAGAAMIAACGLGFFKNFNDGAARMVHIAQIYTPKAEDEEFYKVKYAHFNKMWDLMQRYYQ